tara:strand:- start:573 stop:1214 length:642 start_codon:yes stop_codon:yes gene_type:complete
MSDGIKLGQLLCDADIITKRQLSKALAEQVKGRKGTLGEILVDMGVCSFDDITDALMNSQTNTEKHVEKHEEIHQEPIEIKPEVKDIAPIEPKKKEPIELSEDKVLDTKFTLSVQTMVAAGTGLASLIGMWYALQAEIQEAKELPNLESLYSAEYPSKPEGHNWPRSYEQYKTQVGSLQEDMDDVFGIMEEMEETIKELEKEIKSLERRKRDK